jgi:hypothetical protein
MNPDAHEFGVDNIHKHLAKTVSESPFFPIEAVDLLEKMDMFRRQRRQARHAIHRRAEKEVALIREREAAEETTREGILQRVNSQCTLQAGRATCFRIGFANRVRQKLAFYVSF